MLDIVLGALVMIGLCVFWFDATGSWNKVFHWVRALLPSYSK